MSALVQLIRKAVIAALLTLAAVTPSFAEVGHLEDSLSHSSEVAASQTMVFDRSDSSSDQEQEQSSDKRAHCAFSHCAQLLSSDPAARASAPTVLSRLAYSELLARPPVATPPDRPEDPPRA